MRILLLTLIVVILASACNRNDLPSPVEPNSNEQLVGAGILAPPPEDRDSDTIVDSQEERILRQYWPAWDHDLQESWFPISLTEWGTIGRYVEQPWNTYNSLSSLYTAVRNIPSGKMVTPNGIYPGKVFCNDTLSQYEPGFDTSCNNAPNFVDAYRANFTYGGKTNLVWLHYWQFYGYSASDGYVFGQGEHVGDWEHICVLASLNDLGNKTAPPISIHYHSHGSMVIATSAYAYHSNHECLTQGLGSPLCYGTKHPRAFVQAWGHGAYRNPGGGFADGGPHNGGYLGADEPFNNPMIFLPNHSSDATIDNDIIQSFRGRWGQTPSSPAGPFDYTNQCDHDYDRGKATYNDWFAYWCAD